MSPRSLLVFALGLLAVPVAHAGSAVTAAEEASSRVKTASAVGALGDDLFGEQVSLYTGSTEFSATDLSIPGNNALEVALKRRFAIDTNRAKADPQDTNHYWFQGELGDWELDLPYLAGTFSKQYGWTVGGLNSNFLASNELKRCSAPTSRDEFQPRTASSQTIWFPFEFYGGVSFRSPDGNERPVLFRDATAANKIPVQDPQNPPKLVTRDNWFFTCGVNLVSGQGGEGFLAHGPDGTTIRFDYMVARDERPLRKYWRNIYTYESIRSILGEIGGPTVSLERNWIYRIQDSASQDPPTQPVDAVLERQELRIYPTRIQDRFGNAVELTWSGGKLMQIRGLTSTGAADGRAITLTWDTTNNRLQQATAGTRAVTYAYSGKSLNVVTLPDTTSKWTYDASSLGAMQRYTAVPSLNGNDYDFDYHCSATRKRVGTRHAMVITHPNGATGRFEFDLTRQLRGGSADSCNTPIYAGDNWEAYRHQQSITDNYGLITNQLSVPAVMDTIALRSKIISAPSIATLRWDYDYAHLTTVSGGAALDAATRIVTVTEPQGKLEMTYGSTYDIDEGQLQKTRRIDADGRVLETTDYTYYTFDDIAAMGLTDRIGLPIGIVADTFGNKNRPHKAVTITRDGVNFISRTTAFDTFVRPTTTTRESKRGSTIRDTAQSIVQYYDDKPRWVLGQTEKQWTRRLPTDALIETARTVFNSWALPWKVYEFPLGADPVVDSTFAYNADGTVQYVADALGRRTTFADWDRGVPKQVRFADFDAALGNDVEATVSPEGWVLSVTDQNNFQTKYTYDAMGRAKTVTPPSGEGWLGTSFDFTPVASPGMGLTGQHWRHRTTKGARITDVYYDALLRPVLTHEYGNGTAVPAPRYIRRTFDHAGRESYVSYPSASVPSVVAPMSPGVFSSYDALGRMQFTAQDSELGQLLTTYDYLDGFRTRATNARGEATVTSFQTFDSPDTSRPTLITSAGGTTTTIVRNLFGNAETVTRSGTYDGAPVSLTRQYIYDPKQRLCKRIEPESGATVMAYDAVGNLDWSAEGRSLPEESCGDVTYVPVTERIKRTYDVLNRLKTVSFPDGRQNLSYAYWPDGLVKTGTAGTVVTNYDYNKLRLLKSETLTVDGANYAVGYAYDGSGALSALSYPDLTTVTFAPNWLGQPTKVGTYVADVSYDVFGAAQYFKYDNDVEYFGQSWTRGIPRNVSYIAPNDGPFLYSQDLHYDGNTNVVMSMDLMDERLREKTMAYDDDDRLINVFAGKAIGGNEIFRYDPLDNIRFVERNGDAQVFNYSAQNRLQLVDRTLTYDLAYQHDARGRMSNRGGQVLSFDDANRLYTVAGNNHYLYDAEGRRVRTDEAGTVTHFMYSKGSQLLWEKKPAAGSSIRYHYLGTRLVAKASTAAADLPIPVLTAPSASSGGHTLTWTSVAGATRYVLEEVSPTATSTVHDGAATTKTLSGRTAGSYRYRVAACIGTRCGNYSVPRDVLVADVPVVGVPATSASGNYSVTWTTVAGATAYRLQELPEGGAWTTLQNTTATSRAFTAKAAGAYQYRVCATVGTACVYSGIVGIQVGGVPRVSVGGDAAGIEAAYPVSWTSVAGAVAYQVEERLDGGAWVQIHNATGTSRAIAAKTAGGTYEYRARACLTAACATASPWSLAAKRVVRSGPGIKNLPASVTGRFTVSWNHISGAAGYRLQQSPNGTTWTDVRPTASYAGSTEQRLHDMAPGTWRFRVAACTKISGGACGMFSAVATATVRGASTITTPATDTDGAYAVSWTSVSGATLYNLEESSNGTDWILLSRPTATTAAISGKGNGTYRYRVTACAGADDCSHVTSATASTQVILPPPATALYIQGAAGGTYTVKWDAAPTATSYTLKERFDLGTWVVAYTGANLSTAYSGKGPGRWEYQIEACNLSCGPATVGTRWVFPTPPNLGISGLSSGDHSVSWLAATGADYYQLEERKGLIGWRKVHDGPGTNVLLPDRVPATYYYRIRACHEGGCSAWGNEMQVVSQGGDGGSGGGGFDP